jgi:hypothetical protein
MNNKIENEIMGRKTEDAGKRRKRKRREEKRKKKKRKNFSDVALFATLEIFLT